MAKHAVNTPVNDARDRVTTGPIHHSEKRYEDVVLDGSALGTDDVVLHVPSRRINLTDGTHYDAYDTSGPYTESGAAHDLRAGLPKTRDSWPTPAPPPAARSSAPTATIPSWSRWSSASGSR